MPEYTQQLEAIAATLVHADAQDLSGFDQLQQQMEELAYLLLDANEQELAQTVAQYAGLLAECHSASEIDPVDTLTLVSAVICTLQSQETLETHPGNTPSSLPATALEQIEAAANKSFAARTISESTPPTAASPAEAKPVDENQVEQKSDDCESFLDPEMLAGFVSEATEHLETADAELLNLEADPHQQESLSAVFRAFHTIKGVAGFLELTRIASLAHEAENLLDQARTGKLLLAGPAMDAIFASVDAMKRMITDLAQNEGASSGLPDPALELLLTTLRNVNAGIEVTSAQVPTLPAPASAETSKRSTPPNGANKSSEPSLAMAASAVVPETLKVDRNRLDRLVDMIGELVIAESMVQQELLATGDRLGRGTRNLAQLNKITRNLQELSLSLRMVPVRATFQKMARLVRDLSKKVNKSIDLRITGEDTELDKNVVDQIGDPLIHMIRNAVDHGVEPTADERIAAGKSGRATIELRAFHQGGNIYIEIEDDGRGLNRDKILAKAHQHGLVSEDAELSDREVYDLIFHPGFSTADQITDVSGRGVGMDVVRRNIEALRGSVELRSQPGKGTCFSMRLPLTLAIIEGMVVRVGGNRYILPTLSIVELLRPESGQIATVRETGEFFTMREQHLPLVRLAELFRQQGDLSDPSQGIVVVVEHGDGMFGLLVDEVLGQQQAVTKSLGYQLEGQLGLAGGAVMPDGRVGLILDIHGILELVQQGA